MKMKKVTVDYSAGMPSEINFDDVLSLGWTAALTRMKVTNKGNEIKKNDSTFERHDQFVTAVQISFLINLFDNYHGDNPGKLDGVDSFEGVVAYVLEMLDSYDNIC